MFSSKSQPKRVVKSTPRGAWYCHSCDKEVAKYLVKCLTCGNRRP